MRASTPGQNRFSQIARRSGPAMYTSRLRAAIAARKREVYIAGPERRAIWLKRFCPGVLARMLRSAKVR